ncbi:MAG: transcriptional repressor [Actinobacteria bacterium]|nr:transcriptional repressor [Actinomycetota bacterium]
MTTSTLDQTVAARLEAGGIRYTSARRAVVAALSRSVGPCSAAELYDEVGGAVPLSSLYRTLNVLEEAGVLVPHFGARSVTRYELADWIAGHHHHVVCTVCGRVEDIDVPEHLEARVGEVVEALAGLVAFSPEDHTLEIEGRCSSCR